MVALFVDRDGRFKAQAALHTEGGPSTELALIQLAEEALKRIVAVGVLKTEWIIECEHIGVLPQST